MKPKTIEEIQLEIETENPRITLSDKIYWPEVCKRYAKECCIATLEKASENAYPSVTGLQVVKESITNPDNIVL